MTLHACVAQHVWERLYGEESLDRYRGGFPGDFRNRFGMEIITADLNDYLRIYLLPSLLAFLFVPPPSSRAPRERCYGFITVHVGSFLPSCDTTPLPADFHDMLLCTKRKMRIDNIDRSFKLIRSNGTAVIRYIYIFKCGNTF